MKKTYNTFLWNESCEYFKNRIPFIEQEVEQFLLPRIIKNVKPSSISMADLASGAGGIALTTISKLQERGYTIERLVLIDVLQTNLDAASQLVRNKFPNIKIETFVCNGNNFDGFPFEPVDLLYCWDAMVHFDIHDVAGYLKTLENVLNGIAIFHHSNYYQIVNNIENIIHWRNFMSQYIFQQLAISVGHTVIDQTVIDWYSTPSLDCITTLKINDKIRNER